MLDQNGYDLLEGVGRDRSASASEHKAIVYSGTSLNPAIDESDTLTLVITNNAVPSAQVIVDLYWAPGV